MESEIIGISFKKGMKFPKKRKNNPPIDFADLKNDDCGFVEVDK